ncbi:MAG: hypothetical protein JW884_04345 [Deltaproteobacteria bacterium]|nr:hypothetical protein [Deltaproteobacteria bacterium]
MAEGDDVAAGQVIAVFEAMKMLTKHPGGDKRENWRNQSGAR